MVEDDGIPHRVSQDLLHTDFPLRDFSFYRIDSVMLLRSEY